MTRLEPQPADPELRGYDGFGAPIYQWAEGHACPDCDDLGNMCPDCVADLADSEAERRADGRREES